MKSKKKRNNLRTCFARELKAQKSVKSGYAVSKQHPYVYFERMLLLVPCMESRPTEGSIDNSESNQDDTNSSDAQSYPQRKRRTKQSDFDEQIINQNKVIQATPHQANLSQPLTESQQQSIAGSSYLQLSSPSPETQTSPPPQYISPSQHDQDSIITD
ncbi:unnamed protein product [Euphydryas editha]|uniref:Uncharacterized protein n=1 Tax=Euphydryas editha TaxID=104508 RepID=A0AAU9TSA3_EUPED|nr:unnamed protein product [Euphydryas editha]